MRKQLEIGDATTKATFNRGLRGPDNLCCSGYNFPVERAKLMQNGKQSPPKPVIVRFHACCVDANDKIH